MNYDTQNRVNNQEQSGTIRKTADVKISLFSHFCKKIISFLKKKKTVFQRSRIEITTTS